MAGRLAGRCGYDSEEPFRVALRPDRLQEPLAVTLPSMIAVSLMGDLFHDEVPDDYIVAIYGVMRVCKWHTFLLLTKRAKRLLEWYRRTNVDPPPNVWVGVTAENQQRADERIPLLARVPAAVRYVSIEPMLSPVRDGNGWEWGDIEWVVLGGETGRKCRPMRREWVGDVINACRASRTPFFFKSWGGLKNYRCIKERAIPPHEHREWPNKWGTRKSPAEGEGEKDAVRDGVPGEEG